VKSLPAAIGQTIGIQTKLQVGVVTAVNSDYTLDVDIRGTIITGLAVLGSYGTPNIGDNVEIFSYGSTSFVLGSTSHTSAPSKGLAAQPLTVSGSGTPTSGTTETRDATAGNYTFATYPNRWYKVSYTGRGATPSVTGDRYAINFRYTTDGSTPTASSTQILPNVTFVTVGSAATANFVVEHDVLFAPGAATITMSVFYVRLSGTGIVTPSGTAQLFVEDVGGF
jgi:hypothetical protein